MKSDAKGQERKLGLASLDSAMSVLGATRKSH